MLSPRICTTLHQIGPVRLHGGAWLLMLWHPHASCGLVVPLTSLTCSAHSSQENGPFGLAPGAMDRGGPGEAKPAAPAPRPHCFVVFLVPFVFLCAPNSAWAMGPSIAPCQASHVIYRISPYFTVFYGKSHETVVGVPCYHPGSAPPCTKLAQCVCMGGHGC